jgi:hypothetical protein
MADENQGIAELTISFWSQFSQFGIWYLAGLAVAAGFTIISYLVRARTSKTNPEVSTTLAPFSWSTMVGISRLGGQYIGYGGLLAIPVIAGLVNMYNAYYAGEQDVELRLGLEMLVAYLASLFFTIGSITVTLFAPDPIKVFGNVHNYIDRSPEYQNPDQNNFRAVPLNGPSALQQLVDELKQNWSEIESRRPRSKLFAAVFFSLSALCFSYILFYRAPLRVISAAIGAE